MQILAAIHSAYVAEIPIKPHMADLRGSNAVKDNHQSIIQSIIQSIMQMILGKPNDRMHRKHTSPVKDNHSIIQSCKR
jgi:hypothetical protein